MFHFDSPPRGMGVTRGLRICFAFHCWAREGWLLPIHFRVYVWSHLFPWGKNLHLFVFSHLKCLHLVWASGWVGDCNKERHMSACIASDCVGCYFATPVFSVDLCWPGAQYLRQIEKNVCICHVVKLSVWLEGSGKDALSCFCSKEKETALVILLVIDLIGAVIYMLR